jgi:hypothetical protein
VKAEMLIMGAPKIRAIECGDYLQALEGSHRLAAAYTLGIMPEFDLIAQDEMIDISLYDWYDDANWCAGGETTMYLAGDVAYELHGVGNVAYFFGGDEFVERAEARKTDRLT